MKYIIMAGGKYNHLETPKHLLKVNGEVIIERTIRLLKENGIDDIAISTTNPAFDYLNIPILKHNNTYEFNQGETKGYWVDAFYPTDEETCYIFGDVYFSEEAIKTIIKTKTEDIELFGSAPPFAEIYPKKWIEPFALKVVNTDHLKQAIQKTKELADEGKTWRKNPIMWDLWTVIKDVPLQTEAGKYLYNYTAINDYTTDVDDKVDINRIENCYKIGGKKMVKIECVITYNDLELGRLVQAGEQLDVSNDRADYLVNQRELAKVVEVIPEPATEPEVIVEEVETPEPKKPVGKKKRR